ncbi:uncharacterized protein DUF4272 [Stackebrandtia endophytica]|uniref:Uncharacterized protein DUF4272 n=1 Tax=Stackebrandtia endophytica TaxID=1496996 RepID=A0A543ATX2_9ACTN|nr:DUF4272 domain-containing protein [Stackebrandtia endophytica]TQL76018.1 uncharacterized protein DUF4272 [Stackebrandtia endophytica]
MTPLLFDPRQVRARTCDDLSQLGVPVRPEYLPATFQPDDRVALRPQPDIEARAAILNIVQARVFDMPPQMAMRWLLDARVLEELTRDEWQFIATGNGDPQRYSEQLESLYTLAWMLGLATHLDPSQYCNDGLPALMPDLRTQESMRLWRGRARPTARDAIEVAEMLDLYSCLGWLYTDAQRRGVHLGLPFDPSLVWHRRWALEWGIRAGSGNRLAHGGRPWDQIRL